MKKFVCSVCGYVYEGAEPPAKCPQCGAPKLPHHVCPKCGYYKDREVVVTE